MPLSTRFSETGRWVDFAQEAFVITSTGVLKKFSRQETPSSQRIRLGALGGLARNALSTQLSETDRWASSPNRGSEYSSSWEAFTIMKIDMPSNTTRMRS